MEHMKMYTTRVSRRSFYHVCARYIHRNEILDRARLNEPPD